MSTAHYLHHLANQPRQYSDADEKRFAEATEKLKDSRMDFWTNEGTNKNTDLIWEFFQKNRNLPVTIENIYRAVEQRKADFVWLSQAQVEYSKLAVQDLARASNIENWLASQGTLVNTGDGFFLNAAELLLELQGHDITPLTIQAAIGRIGAPSSRFDTRRRHQLHYVPLPRRVDPRQQPVDQNHKPGHFIDGANKSAADYAREREEALAKNRASQQPERMSVIESRARAEAESLRGNSHAQDAQLGRIFVNKPGGEIDWPATLSARRQMQARFSSRSVG